MNLTRAIAVIFAWSLALGVVGCSEKAAQNDGKTKQTKDEKDADEDTADEGDTGKDTDEKTGNETSTDSSSDTDTATEDTEYQGKQFDLCGAMKEAESELKDFQALVDELCGTSGTLASLREEKNIYTGGDPVLIGHDDVDVDVNGDVISFHFSTSTILDANPGDYLALLRLQTGKPLKFKEIAETDPAVTLSDSVVDGADTTFRYKREDTDHTVEFEAKQSFVKLPGENAWVFATVMTKSIENLEALKGIVVLNALSHTKAEAFTIETSSLDLHHQDVDEAKTRFFDHAGSEQKRMYKNAAVAKDAPALE